jgi:hypothetical protein
MKHRIFMLTLVIHFQSCLCYLLFSLSCVRGEFPLLFMVKCCFLVFFSCCRSCCVLLFSYDILLKCVFFFLSLAVLVHSVMLSVSRLSLL